MNFCLLLLWLVGLLGCVPAQPFKPTVEPHVGGQWRGEVRQIAEERARYPSSYVKTVLEVTGKYNRMMNSPRYLIRSAESEAKLEWQKMQIDFPALANSGAGRATRRLKDYSERLVILIGMVDSRNRPNVRLGDLIEDAKVLDALVEDIAELIRAIQSAIGV